LQSLLALHQGERPQILVTEPEQIESEEDEASGLAALHCRLEAGEVGDAVLPDEADLTIDDAVVEPASYARQFGERGAVVVAVARAEGSRPILHANLKPPAVQLNLVDPVGTIRRAIDQQAGGERDEVGEETSGASPLSCGQTSERCPSDQLLTCGLCWRLCAWLLDEACRLCRLGRT
jgi:hypothetical protein